jgi:thiol-disulfide isomerase/thioredoxin
VPAWGGETSQGETVDSDDLDGVVVLNFWYAGCPPCRVEAPDLEEVFQEYGDRITFLGVNVRDSAATANSFERDFGVSYDSILDVSTRDVLSAFAGQVPPSAVPTTLVLDADGRVAARISGQVPSATTLGDLVDDVLAEE